MAKKARSAAQRAATRKMLAANRAKRGGGKRRGRRRKSRAIVPRRSSSPARSAPRRKGIRGAIVNGFTALVKGKTVETALVGGLSVTPDALVILGELQRVRLENKPGGAAFLSVVQLELFNYTGIWYDMTRVGNSVGAMLSSVASTGSWKWDPLGRYNYDIPGVGRSPLKVGMIDNYGMKFLPRILLRLVKKIPLVAKILRPILNAPNPLRRLG